MPGLATSPRPAQRLATGWTASVADHVIAALWLPGDRACAVGDVSGGLAVFEREQGKPGMRVRAHAHGLTSVACDPRGEALASCGQDGAVRVWNPNTGACLRELETGAMWAERVAWSRDGTLLACAAGRAVRIWDREGRLVREFPTHRATVTDIQWHPVERLLCSTSYGGVTLLNPDEEAPMRVFSWQGSSLVARWSPSGRYIATGEQDSTVHFWIVSTGKDLQMSGYPMKVRALAWSTKGRLLATGGGHDATVWDCSGRGPAGSKPMSLPGHEQPVTALDFRRPDDLLASGAEDGRVVVWNTGKGRKLVGAVQTPQPVSQVAWSADGQALLVGAAGGEVRVLGAPAAQ